jgi:hypothetical protein
MTELSRPVPSDQIDPEERAQTRSWDARSASDPPSETDLKTTVLSRFFML